MRVESQPDLTAGEIHLLTDLYLKSQQALFDTRLDELRQVPLIFRRKRREEARVYGEIAQETAAAVASGAPLFRDEAVAELAKQAGVMPERVVGNAILLDALGVAVTRHHRDCADLLGGGGRKARWIFGARAALKTASSQAIPSRGFKASTPTASNGDATDDQAIVLPTTAPAAPPTVAVAATWCCFSAPGKANFQIMPASSCWTAEVSAIKNDKATREITVGALRDVCGAGDQGSAAVVPPLRNDVSAHTGATPGTVDVLDGTAKPIAAAVLTANQQGPSAAILGLVSEGAASSSAANPLEPYCDGMFSTIWPDFTADQFLTGQYSKSRKAELKSTHSMTVWLAGGDFALADATTGFLSEIRRRYLTLPVDYKNLRIAYEDGRKPRTYLELMQHVEILQAQGPKLATVKSKSWNKHKGTLRTCINWAKANRTTLKTLENGLDGLHIKVKKGSRAAKLERDMTPTSALVALFRTPVWAGRQSAYHLCSSGRQIIRDSLYWVPIVETGNGVRREEICQLRVRHVVARFGFWCLNLLAEDLRLKTDDASPRLVLIHKEVLDAGFLEALVFGRDPDELLFPELSNDNAHQAYGVSYGKRIGNYYKSVDLDLSFLDAELALMIPEDVDERDRAIEIRKAALVAECRAKFCNHGIRHWWKTTAISANCNPAHVDDQLGHVGDVRGEGHRYLKEIDLRALKATVDMVPMPFVGAELRRRYEESLSLV